MQRKYRRMGDCPRHSTGWSRSRMRSLRGGFTLGKLVAAHCAITCGVRCNQCALTSWRRSAWRGRLSPGMRVRVYMTVLGRWAEIAHNTRQDRTEADIQLTLGILQAARQITRSRTGSTLANETTGSAAWIHLRRPGLPGVCSACCGCSRTCAG